MALDVFAPGWRPDLTDQGVLQASLERSGLVIQPFPYSTLVGSAGSGSAASVLLDASGRSQGGHGCVSLTAGALATGSYGRASFPFSGRRFGLWFASTTFNLANLDVVIDGVSYPPPSIVSTWYNDPTTNFYSGFTSEVNDGFWMVADDLPDLPLHQADIFLMGVASGLQIVNLYGYLAESRIGYQPVPRSICLAGSYPLGSSAASLYTIITTTGSGKLALNSGLRYLTDLIFYNSTGSPITVTVSYKTVAIWSASVPANSSVNMPLSNPWAVSTSNLSIQGATGLQVTAFGIAS